MSASYRLETRNKCSHSHKIIERLLHILSGSTGFQFSQSVIIHCKTPITTNSKYVWYARVMGWNTVMFTQINRSTVQYKLYKLSMSGIYENVGLWLDSCYGFQQLCEYLKTTFSCSTASSQYMFCWLYRLFCIQIVTCKEFQVDSDLLDILSCKNVQKCWLWKSR